MKVSKYFIKITVGESSGAHEVINNCWEMFSPTFFFCHTLVKVEVEVETRVGIISLSLYLFLSSTLIAFNPLRGCLAGTIFFLQKLIFGYFFCSFDQRLGVES